MKTATLTFHYVENYGALAQAYALQKKLIDLGYENDIINYRSKNLTNPVSIKALKHKGITRYLLGIIYWVVRLFRRPKFNSFRNQMNITRKLSKSQLKDLQYDAFIVGSDQVWNHDITRMDNAYFLDFVKDKEKRKSYAASFGFNEFPKELENEYRKYLRSFSTVNVRELSSVPIVKALTNNNPEHTVDPTFLLTKEEWELVLKKHNFQNKYLFIYQITTSNELISYAKKAKKILNLSSISVPFPLGGIMFSKIDILAGPREWLGYILESEFVITDSFHGVALSIIFNKPFKVIITGAPSRIVDLLQQLNLDQHIVSGPEQFLENLSYDWETVNKKVDNIRNHAILQIKKSL